jgi:SulP family sulfate permease
LGDAAHINAQERRRLRRFGHRPNLAAHAGGFEHQVQAWRLYGALFFGAVKLVEAIEDKISTPTLVLDLKNVIYIDSSGADALMNLVETCRKKQVRLIVCGLAHQPLDMAVRSGLMAHVQELLQPDLGSSLALAVRLGADPAR